MPDTRMKSNNKAAILGVGTELTTGQILNKNASWISQQLIPFGLETTAQLTVPDDHEQILQGLDFCAQQADTLFVTGGLGPTSDDFTRDVIAEWCEKKLIFDQNSWDFIQQRMASRGYIVKDIQKQQCYYPEGSRILNNSKGTAHGFHVELVKNGKTKNLFVLPGPPAEIEAIWMDSIAKWLFVETQLIDKKITLSWDTLGVPESEVASRVEPCLEKRWPDLVFDLGYRVHLPYVEVKFSYLKSQENMAQSVISQIEAALKNITVLRNFQDITEIFSKLVCQSDFTFYDFVTDGFLHRRLSPELKKFPNWAWRQSSVPIDTDFFQDEENFLALFPAHIQTDTPLSPTHQPEALDQVVVLAHFQGRSLSFNLSAPAQAQKSAQIDKTMQDRRRQYFAEMALIEFVKQINTRT